MYVYLYVYWSSAMYYAMISCLPINAFEFEFEFDFVKLDHFDEEMGKNNIYFAMGRSKVYP